MDKGLKLYIMLRRGSLGSDQQSGHDQFIQFFCEASHTQCTNVKLLSQNAHYHLNY